MSRPAISSEAISDTITVSLCHADYEHRIEPNYWLYDKTRGMNLAVGVETKEKAYIATIEYYQKRLAEIEGKYKKLNIQVLKFVGEINAGENDEEERQ